MSYKHKKVKPPVEWTGFATKETSKKEEAKSKDEGSVFSMLEEGIREILAPPIESQKGSEIADLIEDFDNASKEITDLLNAIRFFTWEIRKYPGDWNIVNYNTGKIQDLIEAATVAPYSEWKANYNKITEGEENEPSS